MAKAKQTEIPAAPAPTPPAPSTDAPAADQAKPLDRAVKAGCVRVKATETICEWVDGTRVVIEAGKEGDILEARLPALGKMVTRL